MTGKKNKIQVTLKAGQAILTLYNGSNILDTEEIGFNKDLDEKLIKGLDKLIKRNKIYKPLLTAGSVQSELQNSTSYCIAQAFVHGLRHVI
ncbi:MAG: hypothetical protein ABH833_03440 [Parcubacteria group bacterium]